MLKENALRKFVGGAAVLIFLAIFTFWVHPNLQAAGRIQYKAVVLKSQNEVQQVLNQHAADGWEFVGAIGAMPPVAVFKK
jgi:hypothetical protein